MLTTGTRLGPPARSRTRTQDGIVRWSGDGSALFLKTGSVPADLSRVEVRTGKREPVTTLAPAVTGLR